MKHYKILQEISKAEKKYKNSLILNPTENIPLSLEIPVDFAENLYTPEEVRNSDNKVIFAGRGALYPFYGEWCELLNAEDASFKANSGLDAHILLFMSISSYGDKVLLLSEEAGGHFATLQILLRLGLDVKEFIINSDSLTINIDKTTQLINQWKPKFIFVDRSEGLYYEDFSWLKKFSFSYKIFDASQYLANIIASDYLNPFDMGFDLILSTLHKNYPGPQKAAFFTKAQKNYYWKKLKRGLATYVSNIHPKEVYKALSTIPDKKYLSFYSKTMLNCTYKLEMELQHLNMPVVKRDFSIPFTQQIWLLYDSKKEAYDFFRTLERINIYTNYRKLPYNLGYGLRLGTAGAVRQGLREKHCKFLAKIIKESFYNPTNINDLITMTKKLIDEISKEEEYV